MSATDPAVGHDRVHLRRAVPFGVAPGTASFVGAWAATLAIGRLTGSSAVLLLLVAGAVGAVAASLAGWWRLRGLRTITMSGPMRTTVGEDWPLAVIVDDAAPRRAALNLVVWPSGLPAAESFGTLAGSPGHVLDGRVAGGDEITMSVEDDGAGTVTRVEGWVSTLGAGGLVWWRRRISVPVTPIAIAPRPSGAVLPVEEISTTVEGPASTRFGSPHEDVDGVRPWRAGDANQTIHWPSTVRGREVVVRDPVATARPRRRVDLDTEPGRLRKTLVGLLHQGADVEITALDMSTPARVRDGTDAAYWSTVAADRARARAGGGPAHVSDASSRPFRADPTTRRHDARARHEPRSSPPTARWLSAFAALVALNMLMGALGHSPAARLAASAGVVAGAALSVRFRNGVAPMRARVVVTLLALGALVRIAVQASGVGGLVEALRGPMPDLLIVLLILHGAEAVNQRTVRVHLAISGVVVAYAAGLRIDENVGWWMLAWSAGLVVALGALTCAPATDRRRAGAGAPDDTAWSGRSGGTDPSPLRTRAALRSVAWVAAGGATVIGLAHLVPVPDGPADLGLPSLANDTTPVDSPGALFGPDGRPIADTSDDPQRSADGSAGSYRGFSETLDTSLRGDLGDEVVMRVRAPEPAFWRGQTFTDFDGRTWRVSRDEGVLVQGPRIDVPPTLGDLAFDGIPTEEFRQTYHLESDLPNLVFAAARPRTLVVDSGVFLRSDGALRTDRTMTSGSIYTVVSQRAQVTEELLRKQGDVAEWFLPAVGDPRLDAFLALPDSTTQRTLELADELRVDASTYDTIRAYEQWLGANTEYDLDAPVPAAGDDAVDDFLFESRRGYCEQIASTLVVMLRSQGVPTRLVTGYIPGQRDRVSGVWEVRARDAHAWVEVWFPVSGWQAFDPTASVPLAGEIDRSTVGSDAAAAVWDAVRSRGAEIIVALVVAAGVGMIVRRIRAGRRRQRRGEWGRLHDRFVALDLGDAGTTGTESHAPPTNGAIAASLDERLDVRRNRHPADSNDVPDPGSIAELLDRVAFDPTFTPTVEDLDRVDADLDELERALRRPVRNALS